MLRVKRDFHMVYTCGRLKVIREIIVVLSLSISGILAGSSVVKLGSQRANLSVFLFLSLIAVEREWTLGIQRSCCISWSLDIFCDHFLIEFVHIPCVFPPKHCTSNEESKRQTYPLVREDAPPWQEYNCQTVINIWSWHKDRLTNRLTISCNATLTWPKQLRVIYQ